MSLRNATFHNYVSVQVLFYNHNDDVGDDDGDDDDVNIFM